MKGHNLAIQMTKKKRPNVHKIFKCFHGMLTAIYWTAPSTSSLALKHVSGSLMRVCRAQLKLGLPHWGPLAEPPDDRIKLLK